MNYQRLHRRGGRLAPTPASRPSGNASAGSHVLDNFGHPKAGATAAR